MKHFIFIFLFVFSCYRMPAQENLVVNPGMEEKVPTEPIHHWKTSLRTGVELAPDWITPTKSTSDYYNSHESTTMGTPTIVAHRGKGRIAFIGGASRRKGGTHYKEYAMGKLIRPLEANKNYCVRFYLALDGSSKYAIDSFGVYFSPAPLAVEAYVLSGIKPSYVIPADQIITAKDGWVEISGYYPASGGEQYITIGSFSTKDRIPLKSIGEKRPKKFHFSKVKKMAYYYLDDVSVTQLPDSATGPCSSPKTKIVANAPRFLFLVDVSGSMNAGGNLDSVKNAITRVVRDLPESSELAVVSFSGSPRLIVPFTSAKNSAVINPAIDSLSHGGFTNVSHSIEFAYNYLRETEKNENTSVYLFTDGIFEVSLPTTRLIQQNYKDHNIKFSTFQFGDRTNFDLQKVASSTSAEYVSVGKDNLSKKLAPSLYREVSVPNTEKVNYTKMRFDLLLVRPLKYWLFILIGTALIIQYT